MKSTHRFAITLAGVVAVGMLIVLGRAAFAQVGIQQLDQDLAGRIGFNAPNWEARAESVAAPPFYDNFEDVPLGAYAEDRGFYYFQDPLLKTQLPGGEIVLDAGNFYLKRYSGTAQFHGIALYLQPGQNVEIIGRVNVGFSDASAKANAFTHRCSGVDFCGVHTNSQISEWYIRKLDDRLLIDAIGLSWKPLQGLLFKCKTKGSYTGFGIVKQADALPQFLDFSLGCANMLLHRPGEPASVLTWEGIDTLQ